MNCFALFVAPFLVVASRCGAIIALGHCHVQGEVLGGLRHGKGAYKRADGTLYEGDWRYDALDGRGKAVLPFGQTYEGEWRGGRAEGCAACQCFAQAGSMPPCSVCSGRVKHARITPCLCESCF